MPLLAAVDVGMLTRSVTIAVTTKLVFALAEVVATSYAESENVDLELDRRKELFVLLLMASPYASVLDIAVGKAVTRLD